MPGVIGLTLQLLTVMLMAITIPRERERGTLDQLMASPITRTELILGKLLPYFGISLLNVATILFVADRWFGIPVAAPVALVVAALRSVRADVPGHGPADLRRVPDAVPGGPDRRVLRAPRLHAVRRVCSHRGDPGRTFAPSPTFFR